VDTATGEKVYLYLESGIVVGRVGNAGSADASGAKAFEIRVDSATAEVGLDQIRSLVHPTGGTASPNELITLTTDTVTLTATATDKDGDVHSAFINLGKVGFRDDAPVVTTNTVGTALEVDETFLTTDDSENFASAFSVNYGADGAGSTAYSLGVKATGVDSGVVDTATGQRVYLYLEGGIVVGRVGVGGSASSTGLKAFEIRVDSATAEVGLDQIRSLVHPTGGTASPNELITLTTDTVTLTATATDKDGDVHSAFINLGDKVGFRDDAPVVTTNTVGTALEVDETFLTTDDSENFASAFSVNYGADGAGSTAYSLGVKATGVDSGVVDTATGRKSIFESGEWLDVSVMQVQRTHQVRKRLKSV
jgi:transcriptional antiterminator Rof (Rho-off)